MKLNTRTSFLMMLILAISFKCYTQVDEKNINVKLLEHQIKILIDSTRNAHHLPSLFNDSILYVASAHHANYLKQIKQLSHEEIGKMDYFSPQDRARTFGAPSTYFVGENVAMTPYNAIVKSKDKVFKTDNYVEIARCFVHAWINSKGHFKNIITPKYQVTGLAIAIDSSSKKVYACQKFAEVIFTYQFAENKEFFPYSELTQASVDLFKQNTPKEISYPFGLRYDSKQKCDECRKIWESFSGLSVAVEGNYFVLRVEDTEFVKKLIKNKKDGFAVEIVSFDPFACGNSDYFIEPSRRNNLKRTSGTLQQPIYRDDLLKGFKKRKMKKNFNFVNYLFTADSVAFLKRYKSYQLNKFDSEYFSIKLGKVPKNMASWWNHNLVYIHNNQICHFVYLTNYPAEVDLKFVDVDYFPPVPVNNYTFKLDYFKDSLDLFYTPKATTSSDQKLTKMVDQYVKKNLTVYAIDIEGLSSVEGNEAENELLHKQRAENLIDQLKQVIDQNVAINSTSFVAWDHFYEHTAKHPKWKFLSTLTKIEISDYFENPKNERPLDILSKERKVSVYIRGVRELSPKNTFYYINRDIKSLFAKDKNGRTICTDEQLLSRIYEKAYYYTTVDSLSEAEFLSIEFPKDFKMSDHRLMHDVAFYRYHLLKESTKDQKVISALESKIEFVFNACGAAEHLSPEFHYLSACLLVEKLKSKAQSTEINDPAIDKAFDRLNLLLKSYALTDTFTFEVAKANLNLIHLICSKIDQEQVFEYNETINSSIIHILAYYRKTNQLNPQKAIMLAKLLCYFQNVWLAKSISSEFLYDNEVLKLYLVLDFQHSSYLTPNNYIQAEKDYLEMLHDAKKRLTNAEWCSLFYGENGIPFQIMDSKELRDLFCENCPNRINEVLLENQ